MTRRSVYRDLAAELQKLSQAGDAANLLRFKVASANPLILSQVEGDLVLQDGDGDLELGDWLKQFQVSYGLRKNDLVWVIQAGEEYQAFDVLSSVGVQPSMSIKRFYIGEVEPNYTDGFFFWVQTFPGAPEESRFWVETVGSGEADGSGRFFIGPDEPGAPLPWSWVDLSGLGTPVFRFDDDGAYVDFGRSLFIGPNAPAYATPPYMWIQTHVAGDGLRLWIEVT